MKTTCPVLWGHRLLALHCCNNTRPGLLDNNMSWVGRLHTRHSTPVFLVHRLYRHGLLGSIQYALCVIGP